MGFYEKISRFLEFLGAETIGIIGGNKLNELGSVLNGVDLLTAENPGYRLMK
ncbi:hypothetical protein [Thermotoga sp.]|uniref:hypothetical protein n=1 Tax=Thermotoga sp. TaxID=28240 RepID=UPI0025D60482|nr:hypothetical protein [Thermotoga sp.]MCD6552102.1 hypothetical protein [Thermotoga sp.]